MKRRIQIICLALLMGFGLAALTAPAAFADDTIYSEGPLYYTIDNESVTIVGCFGKHEEITVPAMIAGYPVNTIASGAFTENEYLKTLYLPDTISRIEPGAIGPGIYVIYNANTDHPQDTPTDLILGLLEPAATEPPAPSETPAEQPSGGQVGSGTEDLDEDESHTVISEQDEDLSGEEPETASPSPAPVEEQMEETSPTENEPAAVEKPEETESEEETQQETKGISPTLWWGIGAVVLAGGIFLGRRKRSK